MEEKYFKYLFYLMTYSYRLIRKSKKKGLQIYRYDGVIVCFLNDPKNKRLLVFYYKQSTKEIFRQSMHFYYVRPIRKIVTENVRRIQEDDSFFAELKKSRSKSYKRARAFKRYSDYQYKLNNSK